MQFVTKSNQTISDKAKTNIYKSVKRRVYVRTQLGPSQWGYKSIAFTNILMGMFGPKREAGETS